MPGKRSVDRRLIAELASEDGHARSAGDCPCEGRSWSRKATRIGSNVARLAIGGAVAYAGLLALLAGVIGLLATAMAWWAAAIVVAVAVGIVGAVMISKALDSLKRTELAPRQTVETLKEDAQWAKQQVK